MLSPRAETILKSIVLQYITSARPVPSQSISDLKVSPATIRNEMAHLEEEGYISRPHTSAGSVPLDKGYRVYVNSIGEAKLPIDDKRLVGHLFHQVERELDEWLRLAATLVARMTQNTAVVTMPKPGACRFKHLELIALQETLTLVILVLTGVKIRQLLLTFDQAIPQRELTDIAGRLNNAYVDSTAVEIVGKDISHSPIEQLVTRCLVEAMEDENDKDYAEAYFDGLHFTLNQPEFAQNRQMTVALMELVEQRNLLRSVVPPELSSKVQVIIGKENKSEVVKDYSVVISRYGLPREAIGTIGVIGPTRMPYARTMATVEYLSLVMSGLVALLYGKKMPFEIGQDNTN